MPNSRNTPAVEAHHRHLRAYSFRSKTLLVMLICCLVSGILSFVLTYAVNRSDVSEDYIQAEKSAADSLTELRQQTSLPVDMLTVMVGNDEVLLTVTDTASALLTADQMSTLVSQGQVVVTSAWNSLPVTYVMVDSTLVCISPVNGLSVFSAVFLRLSSTLMSFIVIFILACVLASQWISRPVAQMTKATHQVAEGNFATRLPENEDGEVGELMRSFNTMNETLSRNAYVQKDFINSISHEFKTPIASIKGYARLLQMPDLTEEQRSEYINMIAQESDRLSRMSQTILRLTALEQQSIPATVTEFSLDEQLRQVIVSMVSAWEEKNIDWQLELSPVTMSSDSELLSQVWANLIQNAVKFSEADSPIAITCTAEGGKAVVRVADHGIGMDEATCKRIFDQFFQADKSRSREGIGLGLSLVKRILDILKGTITVQSVPGEGSEFTVTLPLKYE